MGYRKIGSMEYGQKSRFSKRFIWQSKIIRYLSKNGPCEHYNLKSKLKVPLREERTFRRALEELKNLQLIKNIDGKIALRGQEPPEEIEATIKAKNLELNIPLKREQAKNIIQTLPSIKQNSEAKKVLREAGLI